MHDPTSPLSCLRLAITVGVPWTHLSALLALQRMEEPNLGLDFFEVIGDDLIEGLLAGRYDVGLSLQGPDALPLKAEPLWTESMVVAAPAQSPLLDRGELILADLLDYPLYRWPAEVCPLMDRRLSFCPSVDQKNIRPVTSFEMLGLWVAAGYGVGVTARSRMERGHGWGAKITIRSLADGPYEIVTQLLRPHGRVDSAAERFERRALQISGTRSAPA